MVSRNDRDIAGGEVRPQRFDFCARPQRRIDLCEAAQTRDVILFIQHKIVDARLNRSVEPLLPISGAKLISASNRAMHDMRRTTGGRANLIDLRGRQSLRNWRPAEAVSAKVRDARRLDVGDGRPNELIVFVVNASGEPRRGDLRKEAKKLLRRDARKTFRMGSESRKFESGCAGGDEILD